MSARQSNGGPSVSRPSFTATLNPGSRLSAPVASAALSMPVTLQRIFTLTPALSAALSNASTIVALSSVDGKTRPSSSLFKVTPSASNHKAVSGGENLLDRGPVS
mmetsp:Transcript_35095/g.87421  ORF Transcript_35095/g.87421 Transcript_35095/m.87421 type:complete len:105 (+) Transcript_35095:933-1247(+)